MRKRKLLKIAKALKATVTVAIVGAVALVPIRFSSSSYGYSSRFRTPMSGEALVARGFISREVISVNLATGHVVSAIAVPIIPTGVLVGPGGREAFVFRLGGSEVVPIQLLRKRAGRPINLGGVIDDVVLAPDGDSLYATLGAHTFIAVNMATGRVRFRIQVPDGVGDIVVGQSGSTAYVDATAFQVKKGNGVFGGGDDVTAIDLVRPSVSRVFTLPNTATVLAVTARVLYIAALSSDRQTSSSVLYRVDIAKDRMSPGSPLRYLLNEFFLSPNGQTAYVTVNANQLAPLNLDRLITGKPFDIGPDASQAIFSPNGTYMAVATYSGIIVVNLRGEGVSAPIQLPRLNVVGAYYGATGLAALPQEGSQ
jgi:hypothetical protein